MNRLIARLLVLNALIGPGMALVAQAQMIKLPGRTIDPAPGVEPELARRLEGASVSANAGEAPRSRVRAIVQTVRPPAPADRGRLAAAGVRLSTYLGSNAFFATLERGADLASLTDLIRWAGLVRSTDKIEPALLAGKVEPWARGAGQRIKVVVSLHDDAGAGALKDRLASGWRYLDGVGGWAGELTLEDIKKLASEEAVRWIEQGPHPMMPLPGRETK